MELKKMQRMVHSLAKKKGWWESGNSKTDTESVMLMVTELAEAVEEIRNGRPALYQYRAGAQFPYERATWIPYGKPEGTLTELADCVIRIMDLCEHKGWDLEAAILLKHQYNRTRSYRHGNKKL